MSVAQQWDEVAQLWDDAVLAPPTTGAITTAGDNGTNTPTTFSHTTGPGQTYLEVKVGIIGLTLGNVASVTFGATPLALLIAQGGTNARGELWGGTVPAGTTATITVTYGGGSFANAVVAAVSYPGVASVGTPKAGASSTGTSSLTFTESGAHILASDAIITHFGDADPVPGATQEYGTFADPDFIAKQEGSRGTSAGTLSWSGLTHPNAAAIQIGVPLIGAATVVNTWDPAPAPALFAGALRGTGVLDGFLIVGVVDLLGDLLGRGTLAGALQTGALLGGALTGTGLLTGSVVTGIGLYGAVLGEGSMVGALAEAPPGQILIGALQGFGTLAGFLPGAVVFIPHLFGPDSPVSQTPDLDLNFNALLTAINAPNVIGIGLAVDRPAPGRQGAIWVSTDANDEWYMDDGLQWQTMGAFGQGMVVHDRATDNLLLLGALAAGAGATHVLAAGKATAIPTQALVDGAVLYVADTQGLAGRAAWHHLSEAGHITPLDPVIFRDGIISRNDSTAELTLWAAGVPTLRGKTLPGRYLEVWWHGEVANNTAAVRTLVLRLRFGGVELCAVTLTNVPISATAALASVLFRLDGLTGAVQLAYPLVMTGVGTITAVLTGGTLDASLDQPLDVTGQWNFQSPSLQVRTLGLQVTLR